MGSSPDTPRLGPFRYSNSARDRSWGWLRSGFSSRNSRRGPFPDCSGQERRSPARGFLGLDLRPTGRGRAVGAQASGQKIICCSARFILRRARPIARGGRATVGEARLHEGHDPLRGDGINDAYRTIRVEEKMASPLERLSMMISPMSPRSCISFRSSCRRAHRQQHVLQ
jgi:hypothetical protein